MNYEDAEIILFSIEILHDADAKILGSQKADVRRQERLKELASICNVLWPEITLNRSLETLTQFVPCQSCRIKKPIFLFQAHHAKCMQCEVEGYSKPKAPTNRKPKMGRPPKIRHPEGKPCTKCGEFKPYSDFHKRSGMHDGRSPHCKECRKIKPATP